MAQITSKSTFPNYQNNGKCNSVLDSEFKNGNFVFHFNLTQDLISSAWSFLRFWSQIILIAVILIIVLYVIYKSYWSPVLYVKELTEIGFEHIPEGPDRPLRIARAQFTRKLGTKLPPPYPNGWFAVAESQDLGIKGVKSVDVLGQNLCVYRGEDGVARCVDAYCPHLGANLAVGGNVCGNCIECPFHKWRFADGVCVSVPGNDSAPKGVTIKSWPTVEADGAVWIWHDAEGREPLWSIQNSPELSHWKYRGRNEFTVSSHVQDIPENGADVAHLNAVHSPSLFNLLGEKYPLLLNFIGHHTWWAEWNKGDDHQSLMKLTHDYKIGKLSLFHFDVCATQTGPGHVRLVINSAFGPLLISQSVTPMGPLLQKVIHRIFSPQYNAPFAAFFVRGESYMFERDVKIWNSKRYVSSPTYVRTDRTIRAFRNWFSQFYSENSISFREAMNNPLEW